ncbi:MAG: hypothetical protein OXM62_07240 [bacterium]|nr:hypothetical protein [bacterium]
MTVDADSTAPPRFSYRPELAATATSRDLRSAPRHRWFYFPHSYSYRLVNTILDHWDFPTNGVLADNFSGSGTTLLAARERGLSSLGFDLSPLSVTVGAAKIASYDQTVLERDFRKILAAGSVDSPVVPDRLSRAFTETELKEVHTLLEPIRKLRRLQRIFFLVALLSATHEFSRAVPDGGWFRWQQWPDRSAEIRSAFKETVSLMMADVDALNWSESEHRASVRRADARKLPVDPSSVDGLITSPPYANRHDYSRVFHIGLLLLGTAESQVTKLRHRSIRSHVEAKRPSGFTRKLADYKQTALLQKTLGALPENTDNRVKRLLEGYFEDLYLSLVEVARILRPGGRAAYVVGNVRHAGVMVPADEITAGLATQVGLQFKESWVMRERGNAAQQMGRYGRQPSRESVILLAKDKSP